jgi:phosphate transport system substrate-binding protein
MIKRILSVGLILMMGLFSLIGCGGGQETAVEDDAPEEILSGKIIIAGSTSVQPLSEEIASAFMNKYPEVSVEVQGGGSSVGVKSAANKVADIGAASREIKESEKSYGLDEYVIAKDGIAVIVNLGCGVDNLNMEQIKRIFIGEITNWNTVGGSDADIIVVSREEGSGTRGAFVEITGAEGDEGDMTTANALVQPSTGAVKQTVANTPDSIGYISLGALDDTVKSLKVEGVESTNENILNNSYKIARPFNYLTNGEISEVVQTYIDFVFSAEGQEIVAKEFIPVK